tara:strand:+ start:318 stop:476 length:159 start_codon:yes stop_codon:yes gene_type:complete
MKSGDQFRVLVARMRELQKRYFKERSPDLLMQCKKLERQVDNWLKGQTEMNL